MNAPARLTANGEIAIPRDVLAARGWEPDIELDIVERPDGLLVRAAAVSDTQTVDRIFAPADAPPEPVRGPAREAVSADAVATKPSALSQFVRVPTAVALGRMHALMPKLPYVPRDEDWAVAIGESFRRGEFG